MKKILLVEDDKIMRENTAEILELAGYDVQVAEDGKVAVECTRGRIPDLIICDIMMPKLDGYGVLHILSKDDTTSSIPFIFLTAKADRSDMRKGMELGADDYLTKPFDETELLNAIEARFRKRDLLEENLSKNIEGVQSFLDAARGVEELEDLSAEFKIFNYKKKQIIFSAGDDAQYLYFIVSGKVKTFRNHEDGKEYLGNIYKDGDFFGISNLFESTSYEGTAVALENAEIKKIPKTDFLTLAYRNVEVAKKFMQLLANNVEEKEKLLIGMAYNSVRKRTAEALLMLNEKFKDSISNEPGAISITRDDLANMAGTATETVIRCLGELKEDGYIDILGRKIVVLDPDGLKNYKY